MARLLCTIKKVEIVYILCDATTLSFKLKTSQKSLILQSHQVRGALISVHLFANMSRKQHFPSLSLLRTPRSHACQNNSVNTKGPRALGRPKVSRTSDSDIDNAETRWLLSSFQTLSDNCFAQTQLNMYMRCSRIFNVFYASTLRVGLLLKLRPLKIHRTPITNLFRLFLQTGGSIYCSNRC